MINDYASLSTRAGFNKSLGHFRMVTTILPLVENGANLADVVDELEKTGVVEKSQIAPILNALVIERMNYNTLSFNLAVDSQDFETIRKETAEWNRFDILLVYHHPQLGISLINPKQNSQWETIQDLNREELVVCYIKGVREEDRALEHDALESLRELLNGNKPENLGRFNDPAIKPREAQVAAPEPAAEAAPAPAAAAAGAPASGQPPGATLSRQPPGATLSRQPPGATAAAKPAPAGPAAGDGAAAKGGKPAAAEPKSGGKKRVTPKYSVQVTNELFHNGNVEAWKNIVESYKARFTELEVHIFHDGQKVNNINALFKWGKVKNGDVILFSVAGEDIKGVAKLQRYLFEGASLRFNNFLKKDVNKVLNLFE